MENVLFLQTRLTKEWVYAQAQARKVVNDDCSCRHQPTHAEHEVLAGSALLIQKKNDRYRIRHCCG